MQEQEQALTSLAKEKNAISRQIQAEKEALDNYNQATRRWYDAIEQEKKASAGITEARTALGKERAELETLEKEIEAAKNEVDAAYSNLTQAEGEFNNALKQKKQVEAASARTTNAAIREAKPTGTNPPRKRFSI